MTFLISLLFFFFFTDTATTELYTYGPTLPLHDALPIAARGGLRPTAVRPVRDANGGPQRTVDRDDERRQARSGPAQGPDPRRGHADPRARRRRARARLRRSGFAPAPLRQDRKSTRLNSSH